MARCKDPALNYLNREGYNVVKLPRAGLEPMDVLGRDGRSLERLGKLQRIWTSPKLSSRPILIATPTKYFEEGLD